MNDKILRDKHVSFRVTPEEKDRISKLAEADGMSVGDFLREQLNTPRVRKTKAERDKILQLARIGNNLNQIARWANTYKHTCDALQVNLQLLEIEERLKCL
ncbi:MobC family plasmid mobilization relaxosome protein [Halodesulfovibrio sp.]|jgi:hypothetical protein|uniref:MobC family plasmid mobilization relaxosome protein n=1 Tax=Halodesulfovibrio sp. TaxID=1912772 RepID=UPI0025E637C9|nr:MobC family plasmid mobilization relaxosome protein [Halodesulfovibrio sp.]MCT4534771.1 MobC family plasmid mobilization relaxosome protein [Halodesulfovibrio sp.]